MLVKDLMTKTPACCKPTDTLDAVARLMLDRDCGEIPVCDGSRLVGVITDRDITCRAVATGKSPVAVPARDVMTKNVYTITENQTVEAALDLMENKLVRRLPVVDHDGKLVGMLAQADLVAKLPIAKSAELLRAVSQRKRQAVLAHA